jgi:hypothetical protein
MKYLIRNTVILSSLSLNIYFLTPKTQNTYLEKAKFKAKVLSSSKIIRIYKVDLKKASLEEQIYHYLRYELELPRNHSLGLMANIYRESTFNPKATSSHSIGLFQWAGIRKEKFQNNVINWETNWRGQIVYALLEDVGPEFLKLNFETPLEAATWWAKYWERPKTLAISKRIHQFYLNQINF